MWHVVWITEIGAMKLRHEYVSGRIGNGRRHHLVDSQKRSLCGYEYGRFERSPVGFDHDRTPVDCKTCLSRLDGLRNARINIGFWQEE